MKIIKQDLEKKAVTREMVSNIGNTIYCCKGVRSIDLEIKFNDGSNLGFKKDEMDDSFEDTMDRIGKDE